MVIHPENSWACLDSTTIVSEAKTVARPKVSVVSHPVNSGTCLDTTSSVSAVKQSSILLKNPEDSDCSSVRAALKMGNQTDLRRCTGCKSFSYYSPALKKWGLYWICPVCPSVLLLFRHNFRFRSIS